MLDIPQNRTAGSKIIPQHLDTTGDATGGSHFKRPARYPSKIVVKQFKSAGSMLLASLAVGSSSVPLVALAYAVVLMFTRGSMML